MTIGETTQALSLHPIQTIFKVDPNCIAFFCKRLDILVLNIHEPETTVFTTNNIISTLISPRSKLKYIRYTNNTKKCTIRFCQLIKSPTRHEPTMIQ